MLSSFHVMAEQCHKWYHWVCAMYDDTQYTQSRPFYCVHCKVHEKQTEQARVHKPLDGKHVMHISDAPELRTPATISSCCAQVVECALNNDAVNLTGIPMSDFIEKAVAADLATAGVSCAPVTIRIVSSLLMTSYGENLAHAVQLLSRQKSLSNVMLAFNFCWVFVVRSAREACRAPESPGRFLPQGVPIQVEGAARVPEAPGA